MDCYTRDHVEVDFMLRYNFDMTIRQAFYLILAAVVFFLSYIFIFRSTENVDFSVLTPERGTVIEEVIANGNVEAATELDLAFERGGRIVSMPYQVGDFVSSGARITALGNTDLEASLARWLATESSERAKLNELQEGARPEEIRIQEAKVENARASEDEKLENLIDEAKKSFTESDNAIHNLVDQFFQNPRSNTPQLDFIISDAGLLEDIERGRVEIERRLTDWREVDQNFENGSFSNENASYVLEQLGEIQDFLELTGLAVNSLSASTAHSQDTIDGWRANVSTGRKNVDLSRSSVISARASYTNAQLSVVLAEEELNLLLAGTRTEIIDTQIALLNSASAEVAVARAEIEKTVLRAPFSGTIVEIYSEKGEIVSQNDPVVKFISNDAYEIVLDVPEIDIAQLKLGDKAIFTFDALGREEEEFAGSVITINPSARIVEGVSTYETRLRLDDQDQRIRPGMTTDVRIETRRSEDTLFLPLRSVISRDEGTYVQILEGDNVVDRLVVTGLRDANGNIEILDGVTESDLIVD